MDVLGRLHLYSSRLYSPTSKARGINMKEPQCERILSSINDCNDYLDDLEIDPNIDRETLLNTLIFLE